VQQMEYRSKAGHRAREERERRQELDCASISVEITVRATPRVEHLSLLARCLHGALMDLVFFQARDQLN